MMLYEKNNFINNSFCKNMRKYIGNLSNAEIINLISNMEKEIINGKIVKDDVFEMIIKVIFDRIEDVQTFYSYRKLKICVDKLKWLKRKNIINRYNKEEEKIYNDILELDPNVRDVLIKLLDLENEREEKLMNYLKEFSVK